MVGFRLCASPPATAVGQWTLTDQKELVQLRAALRRTLDSRSLASGHELDEVAERMTIVATELASNALKHARSPAVVTLSRTRSALLLDVADNRPAAGPEVAEERPTTPGGRGLRVVQELAYDTGWYVADGNKHVWAEFAVSGRRRLAHGPRILVAGLDQVLRRWRRAGH